MRLGGNVGIYAQRDRRSLRRRAGTLRERPEFRFALDVEEQIPAFSAAVSSSRVLPTPENTTFLAAFLSAMRTRSSSPPETTSNPHPFFGQQPQDAQVRIGFHRVADRVRDFAESAIKYRVSLVDHARRIDVERRAVFLRPVSAWARLRSAIRRTFARKSPCFVSAIDKSGRTFSRRLLD